MPKFRKRPVVIDAFRYGEGSDQFPSWFQDRVGKDIETWRTKCTILTLEGKMTGNLGDWIIRGVKGEIYPCKPDVFSATYEPAD